MYYKCKCCKCKLNTQGDIGRERVRGREFEKRKKIEKIGERGARKSGEGERIER